MRCIVQSIENHKKTLLNCYSSENKHYFDKDKILTNIFKLDNRFLNSNCHGCDQDDSGFDTSDSSDEKMKQLSVKEKKCSDKN